MRRPILVSLLLLIALFLPLSNGWSGEKPVILAVVDMGRTTPTPEEFLALLEVKLTAESSSITLVERQRVSTLLKEQALALAFDGDNAGNAEQSIRAGQLLGAEALLLIEARTGDKGGKDLAIRLYNAQQGLLIFDSSLYLSPGGENLEQDAEFLAQRAVQSLHRLRVPLDRLLPIGVSTIRSEELSRKWDWISATLSNGLESQLALYEGVAVMARSRTQPLMQERDLSRDFPSALVSSGVLLDGTFKLTGEQGNLVLVLKAKRNRENLCQVEMEGTTATLATVCARSAEAILARLRQQDVRKVMDPVLEAAMLKKEAQIYARRDEFELAVKPAQSAYSLQPEEFEYQYLLLDMLNRALENSKKLDPEQVTRFCHQASNVGQKALEFAVAAESSKKPPTVSAKKVLDTYLGIYVSGFRCIFSGKNPELIQETVNQLFLNQDIVMKRYRANRKDLSLLAIDVSSRILVKVDANPKNSWELLVKYLEEYNELTQGDAPGKAADPAWPPFENYLSRMDRLFEKDGQALRKYWPLIDRLFGVIPTQYPNSPALQLHAVKAAIRFYSADWSHRQQGKATVITMDFSEDAWQPGPEKNAKLKEMVKKYLEAARRDRTFDIRYVRKINFETSLPESQETELKFLQDIWAFALKEGLVAGNPIEWSQTAARIAEILRTKNQIAEAKAVIETMDAFMQPAVQGFQDSVKTQDFLRMKNALVMANQPSRPHPASVQPSSSTPRVQEEVRVVADKEQIPDLKHNSQESVHFRRLVLRDGKISVVVSTTPFTELDTGYKDLYGILDLDRSTHQVGSVRFFPQYIVYNSNYGGDTALYEKGPAISQYGQDLYLGFMNGGLRAIRENGEIQSLTEEQGLADNRILQTAILGDKLFAVVGSSWKESGLMELDLKSGRSRIVVSSRTEDPHLEIAGKMILSIVADAQTGILWVLAEEPHGSGKQWRQLFAYSPSDGQFKRLVSPDIDKWLWTMSSGNDGLWQLELQGDWLQYASTSGHHLRINKRTGTTNFLIAPGYDKPHWTAPEMIYRSRDLTSYQNAYVSDGFVCVCFDGFYRFKEGQEKPVVFIPPQFSATSDLTKTIRDIIAAPEGLYVLTEQYLLLFPNIKPAKPDSALFR